MKTAMMILMFLFAGCAVDPATDSDVSAVTSSDASLPEEDMLPHCGFYDDGGMICCTSTHSCCVYTYPDGRTWSDC